MFDADKPMTPIGRAIFASAEAFTIALIVSAFAGALGLTAFIVQAKFSDARADQINVIDRSAHDNSGAAIPPSSSRPAGLAVGMPRQPDPAVFSLVTAAAFAAGVPADLAHAVVRVESGYQPRVRGAAGEYGLGQIMCATARGIGFTGGCHELLDPATNLRWSMKYLRMALDKGGPGCEGVTLYNTGLAARPHCSSYGRKVMGSRR